MDARNLIQNLNHEAENLPDVICPIFTSETRRVFASINKHPYQLKIQKTEPGWYLLKLISPIEAKIDRNAEPHEIFNYLKRFPKIKCIVVRRLVGQSWFVIPFNESDARQRGWTDNILRPCHLISDNVSPFFVMVCSIMSGNLIYEPQQGITMPSCLNELNSSLNQEGSKLSIHNIPGMMKVVYEILLTHIVDEKKRREELEKRQRLSTIEGRIKDSIEFLGAELVSLVESGQGYSIMWRDSRKLVHHARFDANLGLKSTGMCLDGLEADHNILSTIAILGGHNDDEDYS